MKITDILTELNMSPSALQSFASTPQAKPAPIPGPKPQAPVAAKKLGEADYRSKESDVIRQALKNQGYEHLGAGVDKTVWSKDNGHVVQIIMPDSQNPDSAVKTARHFYNFVKKLGPSPYLPRYIPLRGSNGEVSDFAEFYIGKKRFYQIAMEKLFPYKNRHDPMFQAVEIIMDTFSRFSRIKNFNDFVERYSKKLDRNDMNYIERENINGVRLLNQWLNDPGALPNLKEMFRVFTAAKEYGMRRGWPMDVHMGNVMHRQDGTPVLVDPWFNG